MERFHGVARSKLAPALASRLIERDKIEGLLEQLAARRFILVVAGAGYGKTTFAAQAVAALGLDAAWLGLDAVDRDPLMLFRGLAAGIGAVRSEFAEGFGRRFEQVLPRAPGVSDLAALLAREMEGHAPERLALVLDDFHLVQDSPEVLGAMDRLLPMLPRSMRVFVLGRTLPPLRLSRLRAAREVLDIGEAELAFTRPEAERVCRLLAPDRSDPGRVDDLHAMTGGWPAALALACGGPDKVPAVGEPTSAGLIRQYIRENIFEDLPGKIQAFMLRTSLLPSLDADVCDELLGTGDAREVLEGLSQRRVLTLSSAGMDGSYRYHHLLRDFLRDRLARLPGKDETADIHRRAGELFQSRGDVQNALLHYLAAGALERLCELLSGMVLSDFSGCSLNLAARALESVPEEALRRYPTVLHHKARLKYLRGDLRAAMRHLEQALALFKEIGDQAGCIRCRKDLGFHRYLVGDVPGAFETLRAMWTEPGLDVWHYGETGGLLVFFASLLGRSGEAEAIRDAALAKVSRSEAPEARLARQWISLCESVRLQTVGDFEASDILVFRAIEEFDRAGAEFLLPIAHMQASLNAYYLRRPGVGVEQADKGMERAARIGINDHQHAWLLYTKAANCMSARDFPSAMRCVLDAREAFISLGNPWGASAVKEMTGLILLGKGRVEEAEAAMREALNLIRDTGIEIWRVQVLLGLAEILLEARKPDEAGAVLADLEASGEFASTFHRFQHRLLTARLASLLSQWERASEAAAEAGDLASRHGYQGWLEEGLAHLAPSAAALSAPAPNAASRRRSEGDDPPPLSISCLGGFKVAVGGRAIPGQAWRNAKARRIFQYLALNSRQGFVPKDALLELAWPGEDPERTTGRFHVALHFIRRLLEPGLQRGRASSYLLRRGDAYRLEVGESGRVDAPEFLRAADRAARRGPSDTAALNLNTEAEAMCAGELLPEQYADEWLDDLRLKVRLARLDTLARIMRLLEERKQWTLCAQYAEKHLALEEYSEPAYRSLMRCRAALGDTAGVAEAFRRCRQAITRDLGYPLSPETIALQTSLVGGN